MICPPIGWNKRFDENKMNKAFVDKTKSFLPGIGLCLVISLAAAVLGHFIPLVGGPVFGILLGILIGNVFAIPNEAKPGIGFCGKKVLQYSIVALGASLSLTQIWKTGSESLSVMLITLSVALLGAFAIGKFLGVKNKLTCLIGVGTGICGGSAIAAVSPIIKADDDDIAFSISAVFLFNVAAVIIFPLLGHLFELTSQGFGLWAGTAINDTSSVVAAAYSYSREAGDYATITKLARTTMIIPIALFISFLMSRRNGGGAIGANVLRIFPWFIVAFVVASCLSTMGLLGHTLPAKLGMIGKYAIIVALSGIGLGANLPKMIHTGIKPILLGLLVWILVAITSLGVQKMMGQF
jgi:uncharacterized integral membrane protein (TIGR00698 family)